MKAQRKIEKPKIKKVQLCQFAIFIPLHRNHFKDLKTSFIADSSACQLEKPKSIEDLVEPY